MRLGLSGHEFGGEPFTVLLQGPMPRNSHQESSWSHLGVLEDQLEWTFEGSFPQGGRDRQGATWLVRADQEVKCPSLVPRATLLRRDRSQGEVLHTKSNVGGSGSPPGWVRQQRGPAQPDLSSQVRQAVGLARVAPLRRLDPLMLLPLSLFQFGALRVDLRRQKECLAKLAHSRPHQSARG